MLILDFRQRNTLNQRFSLVNYFMLQSINEAALIHPWCSVKDAHLVKEHVLPPRILSQSLDLTQSMPKSVLENRLCTVHI